MAKTRDYNRFRKIYRYIRRRPSNDTETGAADVIVESTQRTFANQSSKTHTFTKSFTSVPFVTATPFDSDGSATVNIVITAVTTATVTLETSAPFTGTIHIHAIQN